MHHDLQRIGYYDPIASVCGWLHVFAAAAATALEGLRSTDHGRPRRAAARSRPEVREVAFRRGHGVLARHGYGAVLGIRVHRVRRLCGG